MGPTECASRGWRRGERFPMIGGRISFWFVASVSSVAAICAADEPPAAPASKNPAGQAVVKQFVQAHCLDCHDKATATGGLVLDKALAAPIDGDIELWEKVVQKLTARRMPPKESPRPKESEFNDVVSV